MKRRVEQKHVKCQVGVQALGKAVLQFSLPMNRHALHALLVAVACATAARANCYYDDFGNYRASRAVKSIDMLTAKQTAQRTILCAWPSVSRSVRQRPLRCASAHMFLSRGTPTTSMRRRGSQAANPTQEPRVHSSPARSGAPRLLPAWVWPTSLRSVWVRGICAAAGSAPAPRTTVPSGGSAVRRSIRPYERWLRSEGRSQLQPSQATANVLRAWPGR